MIIIKEIPIIDAAANDETAYNLFHSVDRFEGALDTRDDEDWIRIDLVAGETYEINLAGSGDNGAADTILEVFNSDGERVARNDDIDTAGGNLNSMVTFTPDSSGIYYISASSYAANPAQNNSGDYVVTVSGRGDSDKLSGTDADEELDGGAGDDLLEGGAGADMLMGGAGFDIASYRTSDAGVEVSLQDGTGMGGHAEGDTLTGIEALEGSDHDDTLTGDEGDNWLLGNAGYDQLDGGEGDDWLDGGAGYNILEGGAGADVLQGLEGITYTADFEINFDTASYASSDAGVEVRLDEGVAGGGHADGDTLVGIEGLTGSDYDDILVGRYGGNELIGGDGNDLLISRGNDFISGYDWLEGGPGADILIGGDGNDHAVYLTSEAGVEVRLYDGTAKGGDAEGDTFEDIEHLWGSKNDDVLAGDHGDNWIIGQGGNDVMQGREGDDYLEGGPGTDMLDGGDGNDFLQGAEDDDELHGQNGNDQLYGDYSGSLLGETTGGNDILYGGDGDDQLYGRVGDDELYGGNGNDELRGQEGADILSGGAGIDVAIYDQGSDTGVVVRLHAAVARRGHAEGDTFNMETVEYTDADGNTRSVQVPDIENLRGTEHDDILAGDIRDNELRGLGGNDKLFGGPDGGNDQLHGGDGDDKVYGGKGEDTLYGNAGTDTLYGGPDNDHLLGGPGADTLIGGDGDDYAAYWDADSAVEVRLHDGVTRGEYAEGDTFESIERLKGSNHDDILEGDSNDNALHGGPGNDVLDGKEGNDWLEGNEGADVIRGGEGDNDVAAYYFSEAAVEVRLYDGTATGGDAEGDTFEGIEKLFGSMHDDSLAGDENDNKLEGFVGNDVLDGREGDDRFSGGEGDDTFVFAPGHGDDYISDFGNGDDSIGLSAFEDIESMADLAISQEDHGVVIDLTGQGGGTITLEGYNQTDLTDADFIF